MIILKLNQGGWDMAVVTGLALMVIGSVGMMLVLMIIQRKRIKNLEEENKNLRKENEQLSHSLREQSDRLRRGKMKYNDGRD